MLSGLHTDSQTVDVDKKGLSTCSLNSNSRPSIFASWCPDSAEGKGVASGEAVMIKSHPYPHPGVVALLRLASEYRVASFQFKLFAMQVGRGQEGKEERQNEACSVGAKLRFCLCYFRSRSDWSPR